MATVTQEDTGSAGHAGASPSVHSYHPKNNADDQRWLFSAQAKMQLGRYELRQGKGKDWARDSIYVLSEPNRLGLIAAIPTGFFGRQFVPPVRAKVA
jgi:hypothetical protein